jgi:hypothetical protein
MRKTLVDKLGPEERQKFEVLETERQREGFLIVRAFAGLAELKKDNDFQISRASLADRLSMTPPGAGKVILKLRKETVIAPTQPCVIHKESARYCWLLPKHGAKAPTAPLVAGALEAMYQNATPTEGVTTCKKRPSRP